MCNWRSFWYIRVLGRSCSTCRGFTSFSSLQCRCSLWASSTTSRRCTFWSSRLSHRWWCSFRWSSNSSCHLIECLLFDNTIISDLLLLCDSHNCAEGDCWLNYLLLLHLRSVECLIHDSSSSLTLHQNLLANVLLNRIRVFLKFSLYTLFHESCFFLLLRPHQFML